MERGLSRWLSASVLGAFSLRWTLSALAPGIYAPAILLAGPRHAPLWTSPEWADALTRNALSWGLVGAMLLLFLVVTWSQPSPRRWTMPLSLAAFALAQLAAWQLPGPLDAILAEQRPPIGLLVLEAALVATWMVLLVLPVRAAAWTAGVGSALLLAAAILQRRLPDALPDDRWTLAGSTEAFFALGSLALAAAGLLSARRCFAELE